MFMQQYQGHYSVMKMAKDLGVSRSGYYAWINRKPSQRETEDRELLRLIIQIFEDNESRYGSPRIWRELVEDFNWRIGRKRVERLMREEKLRAKRKPKAVKTTDSNHNEPVCENLLARDFKASGPGEKWVTDITYLRTLYGWLYLTVIIDLYDRKVIGWAISASLETSETSVPALEMVVMIRFPSERLIFHSDRGVQYCSKHFRQMLYATCPSVQQSMSRKGNVWDNACAESFFKTLKWELDILNGKHTRQEVKLGVFEYIEMYYNRRRRHSALGYATPLALTNNIAA
jgi:transposase InsO family protein